MADWLSNLGIPPASPDPTKNIFGGTRPFGFGVPSAPTGDAPPGILAPNAPPSVLGTRSTPTIPTIGPGVASLTPALPVAPPPVSPVVQGNSSTANYIGRSIAGIPSEAANQVVQGNPLVRGIGGGIADFFRGLGGQASPQDAPTNIQNMKGRGLPATSLPVTNMTHADQPESVAAAAPTRRGFSALTPASAAAIAAFLPRQRMPQEIAGDALIQEATRQRDEAVRGGNPAQIQAAQSNLLATFEKQAQVNNAGAMALTQQLLGQGIQ